MKVKILGGLIPVENPLIGSNHICPLMDLFQCRVFCLLGFILNSKEKIVPSVTLISLSEMNYLDPFQLGY